jgi:acetoin utilization deacetylase AcuC-like enzyme
VRLGAKTVEMEKSRKNGFCCGAGGGRVFLEETIGKRVNVERTEQALATGAKTVAVGCPFCMTMMTDGTKAKDVEGSVQVKDLAELVAERLRRRRRPLRVASPTVFGEHDAGPGHPERPERVTRSAGASEPGSRRLVTLVPRATARAPSVTRGPRGRVAATAGSRHFDPTPTGPRSYAAAVRAAGPSWAVEKVLDGTIDGAFCNVRPPGHHATRERAMGFCLFNNVAVGAAAALARGLTRVAVIDFDVHHGNGTQEAFYRDPRVLYVSSHRFPFYPGTGDLDEVGEGDGRGFTVNLPMPAALGDGEYRRAYREIVEPIGRAFDPELVLVSAGFDPHRDDPLGGMAVTSPGFAELIDVCLAVAAGAARGRLVAVLEGGYDLDGIADSAAAVVGRMLGRPPATLDGATRPGMGRLLDAYRETHGRHWPMVAR